MTVLTACHVIEYNSNMTQDHSISWGLAGLTNADGELDRPTSPMAYDAPRRVELDGDLLLVIEPYGRGLMPDRNLLDRFVAIDENDPKAIEEFAQRFGVLRLCGEHGLPRTHAKYTGDPYSGCELAITDDGFYSCEHLKNWRFFIRSARAMLNIAARLHDGKTAALDDWRVIYSRFEGELVTAAQWSTMVEQAKRGRLNARERQRNRQSGHSHKGVFHSLLSPTNALVAVRTHSRNATKPIY